MRRNNQPFVPPRGLLCTLKSLESIVRLLSPVRLSAFSSQFTVLSSVILIISCAVALSACEEPTPILSYCGDVEERTEQASCLKDSFVFYRSVLQADQDGVMQQLRVSLISQGLLPSEVERIQEMIAVQTSTYEEAGEELDRIQSSAIGNVNASVMASGAVTQGVVLSAEIEASMVLQAFEDHCFEQLAKLDSIEE